MVAAKISTITTVKNEGENIGDLLESLLGQSYMPDEIIISDGGSTDDTEYIIREYQKKHGRIKFVSAPNTSIGGGRNAAIRESSGDILLVIDSGIKPDKDWIKNIIAPFFTDKDLEVAYGHVIFDTKSRFKPISDFQKIIVFLTRDREDKPANYLPGSAIKKSIWERMGSFPENPYCEDIVLLDKLREIEAKSTYVKDAVVYYYSHPDGYKQTFRKWVVHTRNSVLSRVAYHGYYRQLILRAFSIFLAAGILVMTILDIRVIFLLIMLFSLRFLRKWQLNRELGNEIFKRPSNWIRLFLISSTLDLGRTLGAFEAFYERLFKQRFNKA